MAPSIHDNDSALHDVMVGFEQVAKEMKDLFFNTRPNDTEKRVQSAAGTSRNAFKQLNSLFREPSRWKAASNQS